MDRKIIYYLAAPLPLAAIILICYAIYYNNTYSNLALNLGTELIGILLVVLYVNWIIKKNEEKKWARSMDLILENVRLISGRFFDIIQKFLDLTDEDIFDNEILMSTSTKEIVFESLRVAEDTLLPMIMQEFHKIPPNNWKELNDGLNILNKDLIRLILIFGNKMEPNFHSQLLGLQIQIENIIKIYGNNLWLYDPQVPAPRIVGGKIDFKKLSAQYIESSLKITINLNKKSIDGRNKIWKDNKDSLKEYVLNFERENK